MEKQQIHQRIRTIFTELFDDPALSVERETSARDVESWDSISHINLVMQVEREFDVKFALGEMQDLQNVGEMIDLVHRKLA